MIGPVFLAACTALRELLLITLPDNQRGLRLFERLARIDIEVRSAA